ncbi:MAG TPA: KpsF/GutQ family sugar-phosphate isomerase [Pseudobdellovibrionaceae bacterium]|nr:KpsF/GutQ family sugar-phosphate isomerase [Pseudobdellovibrionaceae bacterium]
MSTSASNSTKNVNPQRIKDQALRVFNIESKAILDLKDRIDEHFLKAVHLITQGEGKLIVTGIGKSGQIGRKIASTFSSTGTPSVFLHPAESLHGDLGVVGKKDIVLAISYGGESAEFNGILNYCARHGIPVIAMTGKPNSTLARSAQYLLNVSVSEEACPLGLAPTASSTASLAMGDALAMAVLNEKGFQAEEFAEYHPGGSLGFKLLTRVKDVMHQGESLPLVSVESSIKDILGIMTQKNVRGVAGVVDLNENLIGVITDGDIRRRLQKHTDPLNGSAKDIMTLSPRTIDANELAEKALFIMEQFKILMLFVVDQNSEKPQNPVGMIHIHDMLQAKLR